MFAYIVNNMIKKLLAPLGIVLVFAFSFALLAVSACPVSAQGTDNSDKLDSSIFEESESTMTIDAIKLESDNNAWKIHYEANNRPNEISIEKSIFKGILFVLAIYIFFSLLAVILILSLVIPRQLEYAAVKSRNTFWKTNAYGLILAIFMPWAVFLLAITLIGMPLAVMLGVAAVLLMFLSGPFSGYAIGQMLIPDKNSFLKALTGGTILLILYFVPIVNILVLLGAYIYGMGMIINLMQGYRLSE